MRFFNFFSNILITKGANRILISDLQRNVSELHSKEFNDILEELKNNSIEDISKNLNLKSKKKFQEYLDFLLDKEYGFITENDWDKNFPPLSYEYKNPSSISNLFAEIIDISVLQKIKQSIEKLQIQHLIIHFDKNLSLEDVIGIDRIFEKSILQGIEIYSHYHKAINSTFINDLNLKTARIYNLVFYNCNEVPFQVEDNYRFDLTFTNQSIKMNSCGKVDFNYFNTNLPKILEAINHNSCLHKKISIDSEGNIRNCPSMPQSFGNIKDTTLEEALHHKDFKKYWDLNKDKIEVCKDCEFRYICTDCRAYTERTHEDKEGLDISKPLKCGYNPYTGEWEEWSTNPLKEKAIKYYGMQELVKKN